MENQNKFLINKLNSFINNKNNLIAQIAKFSVVGVISFIIDAGVLYILTVIFGVKFYLIFAAISFSASVVVNYILSMRFIFEGRKDIKKQKEFVIFVVLSVIGLLLNQFVMWFFGILFSKHMQLTSELVLLIKIISTCIVMVWNFISRKVFLEQKK